MLGALAAVPPKVGCMPGPRVVLVAALRGVDVRADAGALCIWVAMMLVRNSSRLTWFIGLLPSVMAQ